MVAVLQTPNYWETCENTVTTATGVSSGPVRMIRLHCPTPKTPILVQESGTYLIYATRVLANLCLDSQLTVTVAIGVG